MRVRAGPTENDRLLTEQEAIRLLGLSDRPNPVGALRWLCRTKRLAYIRVGRGIRRFRRGDLQAFIESNLENAVVS